MNDDRLFHRGAICGKRPVIAYLEGKFAYIEPATPFFVVQRDILRKHLGAGPVGESLQPL